MKNNYILLLFSLFLTVQLSAQTIIDIPASSDPAVPTDIFPVIMGDTTATGERNDNNTIYRLENGQVYITTGRIVNKPEWDLHIEAVDLTNTEAKPIITRIPNASGTFPDIMRPEGNVTMRNLWIVSGEKGPLEQHDWGKVRFMGENTRIIAEDCIIEKDRGGFFQIRANGIKAYITNCVLRNGGNRRILQGNGRGFDSRNFSMDTLIMKNTIVHNIQDRFFRSQGASAPHNYIEIDHCTSFNTAGRHGFIQLGRVTTAKITNNLFMNPILMGSSPVYTDEQTQPDSDLHKVITLDTLYDNTALTVSNNNIFWTEDVTNFWASNDTISAPGVLSDLIVQNLGGAADAAFFSENVTLNSVPVSILEYVTDLYADPTADDMFDFIVEDEVVAGTAFDSGNLFNFSAFDPCYAFDTESASASDTNGPIGAVNFCPQLTDVSDTPIESGFALSIYPNPTSSDLGLSFDLKEASEIHISITDISGKAVVEFRPGIFSAGQHTFTHNISNQLSRGLHFVTLKTEEGAVTKKLIVR